MTYLIDTCVMSEFVKKVPNSQVSQWFNQQPMEQLFLSSITIAEIKKGIYKIQNSQPERYQKLKILIVLSNYLCPRYRSPNRFKKTSRSPHLHPCRMLQISGL